MKFLIPFFLVFPLVLFSQNANRQFVASTELKNGIQITVSDGNYYFYSYNQKVIETTFIPLNEKSKEDSHAVSIAHESTSFKLTSSETNLSFSKPNGIEVRVQKSPFKISYWYQGKELISEKMGYEKSPELEKIEFNLTADEVLYGGGARALGMNRRGNRLQLYNRAHYGYEEKAELMNYCLPMVLSNKIYAIHFDNAAIGFLDLDSKKNNTLSYETISGRKTYQVIVGEDWKDLVEQYTFLTGRQPMPPRWAFGNFASRFGYHSEAEARKVVNQFRKDSIPLDAIIFDLYWFGKEIQGTLGNLEFHKDSFPTPEKMISDFKAQQVKTVLITEPFILTTSKKWNEAVDKKLLGTDSLGKPFTYDFYFGNTGLLDIYQPHVRTWFWNVYKDLANKGVKGFWGDLGEPEVHPSKLLHGAKTADQVHNIYGHDWARLISEGFKKDFPLERPFILMRAGYSGTQKYGIIPWSGDVNRTWGGMKPQVEISLQMGLQGIAYMHSDLGGFAGNNDEPELYSRWLQYGVFQPIFRPHAQEEVASEPIFKDEKTKALAKKSIELRYQLLPYNYTLAFENHTKGTPLMRPVFIEETSVNWSDTSTEEYFWGDAFLVKPITDKSQLSSSNNVTIILPKNSFWYDFQTGKLIENNIGFPGKKEKTLLLYNYEESFIPVFVKAGSFIPMSNPIQSTDEYKTENVTLHFYDHPSVSKSEGMWYEDDGLTADAYEKGMYNLLKIENNRSKKSSEITFNLEKGNEQIQLINSFQFEIHFVENPPKKVKVNGKRTLIELNVNKKYFSLPLSLQGNTTNVKIKW
jgi:alpha-glucosidase (family GH31 glycosyl hydrolase)